MSAPDGSSQMGVLYSEGFGCLKKSVEVEKKENKTDQRVDSQIYTF